MATHLNHIVVATDEKIHVFSPGGFRSNASPVEFSLEEISSLPTGMERLPGYGKNGARTLLVVPDLWLKQEFFAFQSQKNALVNAFLERKLKAAYPHLPQINRFFTFSLKEPSTEERGVTVFFLQEQKAFLLNGFLARAKLRPQWITTPALLWAERLLKIERDFKNQGVLLVDLRQEQVFLYFFSRGEFLFSRRLALADGSGRWESLLFEINQSIYLYAQKAKSVLNKICVAGDIEALQKSLSGKLDIPIHRLEPEGNGTSLPRDLSFLEGVWSSSGIGIPSEVYSITDRTIRHELKWKPVQWCGILTAAVSIIAFSSVNLWLDSLLQDKLRIQAALMEKHSQPLAEIEQALDALTHRAGHTPTAHALMHLDAALPESMLIREVKINHETSSMELSAAITADHIDRFRQSMKLFADNLSRQLDLNRAITIEDMAFQVDDLKVNNGGKTTYRISLKAIIP